MWIGPINFTDVQQVTFWYLMWDDLHVGATGTNNSTFGIVTRDQLNKDQTFVSGMSKSVEYKNKVGLTSSDASAGIVTLNVSDLKGEYYIKVYVKHSSSSLAVKSGAAYTGFRTIKVCYDLGEC